jgi:hypothetical protein
MSWDVGFGENMLALPFRRMARLSGNFLLSRFLLSFGLGIVSSANYVGC